ncbi:LysM peptidoglycan-binding domain-containing protein [Neptunitalea chrysea]|nr:LysM peptidoglycan-binding domain-containing protein [Neptunitalea chrysea]
MSRISLKYVLYILILLSSTQIFAQKIVHHTVKYGETKYRLSKVYEISIEELERQNPEIAKGLYAGQELTIDTSYSVPKRDPEGNYIKYLVKKGESKSLIAKRYNISIAELDKANPDIQEELFAFEYIFIPVSNEVKKAEMNNYSDTSTDHTASVEKNLDNSSTTFDSEEGRNSYVNMVSSIKVNKEIALAILFPDTITSNTSYGDFEKGAQMAIDSVKSLGLHVTADYFNLKDVVKSGDYSSVVNYENVISLCNVKATSSIINKSSKKSNLVYGSAVNGVLEASDYNVLFALSSDFYRQNKLLGYLTSQNGNIIIINDEESTLNEHILKMYPQIKILTSDNGIVDESEFSSSLASGVKNFVILNTTNVNSIINTTNFLLPKSGSYSIQLASFRPLSEMVSSKISIKRYLVLKLIYTEFEGCNQKDTSYRQSFTNVYKKKYSAKPTDASVFGFDITFDFLVRLAQGEDIKSQLGKKTKYVSVPFEYTNVGDNVFTNSALKVYELIDYNNSKELK